MGMIKRGIVWLFGLAGLAAVAALVASCDSENKPAPEPPSPGAVKPGFGVGRGPDPALPPIETLFDLSDLRIPREKILRGRQPKDGIHALDDPATSPVADASFLRSDARIVAVTVDGISRAYPLNVLNMHEAINDRLGNIDLLVTYCSLCDSVTVCDRRLEGKAHRFGVSGLIYESNMILFDRTSHGLWSQLTSSAVSGPDAGRSLRRIHTWEITTFGPWRSSHPTATVVNFQTGFNRPYDSDPHREYLANDRLDRRFQNVTIDDRLRTKEPVIGVSFAGKARAYPIKKLEESGLSTVVDRLGDGELEFAIDAKAKSVRVIRAPDAAIVVHSLWFAWAARFPGSEIYAPPADRAGKH
jgi:hypothetical protein